MSVLTQILSNGKQAIPPTERVAQLPEDRKPVIRTIEDHEKRLVPIETVMEFASPHRRVSRD
jgi:hypothetical protein